MKIGYARVSTEDQKLSLQLDALKKGGCERIFKEKVSGVSRIKPELQKLLDQLRRGDTVVIWKLDRLARSTRELLETVETIGEAGAKFQSLSEPWADTTCVHVATVYRIVEKADELLAARSATSAKGRKRS